jgi:hypothetical protein
MNRFAPFVALPLMSLAMTAGLAATAENPETDRAFFKQIEGNWMGPGEIIAGKFKGTKFVCNFAGSTPSRKIGMTLDGDCRVGMFSQKMTAKIEHRGGSYSGQFLDGAEGSGMDIVAGSVVDGQKVVFSINRKALNGVMQARITAGDTMTVTVSVRVDDSIVPVIGMNLKRVDVQSVGAINP